MFGPAGSRFRGLPIRSLIPNSLTVLALCAGLTSMRFALQGHFQTAVTLILVAAVIDGLDGRMARLLKGTSRFGAELDSLSDFVCFGVAPAFLLYQWSLSDMGGLGWMAVVAYAVCCALRLARFNTMVDDHSRPAWTAHFFTGVSSPAAAGLAMLFIILSFEAGDTLWRLAPLNALWLIFVAALMVSRLPSYSFKKLRIRREAGLLILLGVALTAGLLISFPWYTLFGFGVLYLLSLPLAYRSYIRHQERDRALPEEDAPPPQAPAVEDEAATRHLH
ncbi:MAG: CDP-diacylglycerol--serine O-phosphatidyltransferase [Alphaproteobacteria bacterium]|nr:CDP-diacylglycerol--serine O-phosphatidyltransferase [Alphaproteobacteria bacterium]